LLHQRRCHGPSHRIDHMMRQCICHGICKWVSWSVMGSLDESAGRSWETMHQLTAGDCQCQTELKSSINRADLPPVEIQLFLISLLHRRSRKHQDPRRLYHTHSRPNMTGYSSDNKHPSGTISAVNGFELHALCTSVICSTRLFDFELLDLD
jgi:hypothetical protein